MNSDCRQKVYDLFSKNNKVFDKVIKANGQLRPSWHQAFQKKIITSSEYNKFLESEEENLNNKIEKKFRELIDNDLPKIQQIFETELNK